jgi:pantoate--beta-alanine ligase
MQTVSTIGGLRECLKNQPGIALVPTMGNLHAGHIHLVELAKQRGQCVVVSIFVNPLQFGHNEDLASYPRTLDDDLAKLEAAGADIVFMPTVNEMYPATQSVTTALPAIASELCGASRPGHFAGVATVVLKLFNAVFFNTPGPSTAIFGKKDFQQLFIIRQLVEQLNLPIEIIAGETVREADGLAMSSRNSYLTAEQRSGAPGLAQVLQQAVQVIQNGRMDFASIEAEAARRLAEQGWTVDYISVRSASTLMPGSSEDMELVVLGAAKLGQTRLIDNIEFRAKP